MEYTWGPSFPSHRAENTVLPEFPPWLIEYLKIQIKHACKHILTLTMSKKKQFAAYLKFLKVLFHVALDISEPWILFPTGFVLKNVTSSFS